MVQLIDGDLLQSDCTIRAHVMNCFSDWSDGLARTIHNMYPEAVKADAILKATPDERFGQLSVGIAKDKGVTIFNLYGQFKAENHPDFNKLQNSLKKMMEWVIRIAKNHEGVKLGIPSSFGYADECKEREAIWNILEKLSAEYHQDIFVYKKPN